MSSKILQVTWIVSNNSTTDVSLSASVKQTQQRLQTELGFPLKVFNDVNKCIKEFEDSSSISEKRILILDANVVGDKLHLLHNLCHVVRIFIYWMNSDESLVNSLQQAQSKYEKVVVLRFDDLLKHVQVFDKRWRRHATDFFPFATFNTCRMDRSSTSINSSFLSSQLLIDLLLRTKPLENDREDFCARCVQIYQEKYGRTEDQEYLNKVLEQIRNFQMNIHSTETIMKWYTKSAFLCDIVNTSFRTNDVETIFHSRFVIREMHQQLIQRHMKSPIRVYRGQRISSTEAELLADSIGKLVSMKSFLSTSLDPEVAEAFADIQSNNTDEDIAFVMFIIDAIPNETNTTLRPFGDITDISEYNDEREILFMVGSVFRITNVKQSSDKRWIISMTMCDEEDVELNKVFSWLKDEQNINGTDDNPYYEFATLLLAIDMPNAAQQFCNNLLYKYSLCSSKNNELAKCHYMLGKAALLLGLENSYNSWSNTPSHLEELWHDKQSANNRNRNCRACIAWPKLKFSRNRRHLHFVPPAPTSFQSSHLVESLKCFQRALVNIDKTAANYHFLAGNIHHSAANAYRALANFKGALVCYEMALLYYRKSFGMTHRLIAELYADLGRMYYEKKHLRKALEYHQHALEIAQTILPETHLEMGIFHMGLIIVYAAMDKKDEALFHIAAVAKIDLISLPNGKPLLSAYYGVLDIFFEHKESFNTFLTKRDNIDGRRTIQRPNAKRSRSLQPEVIFYSCPWCRHEVWIYRAFAFCKGSPCFQCFRRVFTFRLPRMQTRMRLYLEYMASHHESFGRNERLNFFAHQLRQNYIEAPIRRASTASN